MFFGFMCGRLADAVTLGLNGLGCVDGSGNLRTVEGHADHPAEDKDCE